MPASKTSLVKPWKVIFILHHHLERLYFHYICIKISPQIYQLSKAAAPQASTDRLGCRCELVPNSPSVRLTDPILSTEKKMEVQRLCGWCEVMWPHSLTLNSNVVFRPRVKGMWGGGRASSFCTWPMRTRSPDSHQRSIVKASALRRPIEETLVPAVGLLCL